MQSEKNVVIVVAQKDFRDEEFAEPRRILEEAGIGVKVASSTTGECFGINGLSVEAELDLSGVVSTDLDGIIFAGGPGVQQFFGDDTVSNLAREFNADGKLVCAICWASVILADAGLLQGKKATAWAGAKADVISKGALWSDDIVVVDGNIVTANGPEAADEFAQAIANILMG